MSILSSLHLRGTGSIGTTIPKLLWLLFILHAAGDIGRPVNGLVHFLEKLNIFQLSESINKILKPAPTANNVRKAGYLPYVYNVTTQPGYKINLIRIVNPLIDRSNRTDLPTDPVLFIHGILMNANVWIEFGSLGGTPHDWTRELAPAKASLDQLTKLVGTDRASSALPYLLSNFGYDVWLMNRRPTRASLLASTENATQLQPVPRPEPEQDLEPEPDQELETEDYVDRFENREQDQHQPTTIGPSFSKLSLQTTASKGSSTSQRPEVRNRLPLFKVVKRIFDRKPLQDGKLGTSGSSVSKENANRSRRSTMQLATASSKNQTNPKDERSESSGNESHRSRMPSGKVRKLKKLERISANWLLKPLFNDFAASKKRTNRFSKFNNNYWRFSFDEQVEFDLPIVMDFILATSHAEKINLVGHSAGALIIAMMLAANPGRSDKVRHALLMAPPVNLHHLEDENPIFKAFKDVETTFSGFVNDFSLALLIAPITMLNTFRCLSDAIRDRSCHGNPVDPFFGLGTNQWNSTTYLRAHNLVGSSSGQEIAQFMQAGLRSEMHHFDFRNPILNMKHYGSLNVPVYNMSAINLNSISIWQANTDRLVNDINTQVFLENLKVPYKIYNLGNKSQNVNFNHLGFHFHSNVTGLLNIPALIDIARAQAPAN